MNRRNFLKSSLISSAALSFPAGLSAEPKVFSNDKTLNAYYFRAHMYTMVPRQVREDLQWMADLGTNVVSVAVLEQDLFAAVENVEIICNEAEKLGMAVYAVPSRWGGMVAGAPKVPSLFSVQYPKTWVLEQNGEPKTSSVSGVISSVHYPETFDFFTSSVDKIFELWDIKGVIWDEPKSFRKDYSPKAIENLGKDAPEEEHYRAVADFYSRVNRHIKQQYPDKVTAMFAHASWDQNKIDIAATISHLDHFGCDGRPWYNADGGKQESGGKVLLGENAGERYLTAARQSGKKTLWLIENHNMAMADAELMDRRLREVLKRDIDHLIYYYYPRNLEDPEKIMGIVAKHVKGFRS